MSGNMGPPQTRQPGQIGNFPQAFSHLARILTARIIEGTSQNARSTS
jgi:hypothetical protein